ncbi:Hypothetical predicted protein [Cloeon dipterum]|uniref:RRM domain-containing protein n=1 Tax=Cloeon dipterum TaxID=197152 RepID=A0A8S1D1Q0_9INSE|nr:Hypothetical predicted protein [Cloeon dipterum]
MDRRSNHSDGSHGGGGGGSRNECRIYVGNLPPDIRTKDIQDLFYKFGKVTFVDLKNRRGPPFAFVEFDDPRYYLPKKKYRICIVVLFCFSRDAEDAVHARDGYDYDGYRLRVEFPRGGGPGSFRGRGGGGGGSGGRDGRGRGPPARRSQYRVLVTDYRYPFPVRRGVQFSPPTLCRTSTVWQLAGLKRPHERSRRCVLC